MFGEKAMEEICERINLEAALRRVRANRGGPGVDGRTVDELPEYLKANWPSIKEQLLSGEYPPRPVKGVEIPKPGRKGKRRLGIPCVIDRFIEQAMLQVLQRRWDRRFSDSSYGYRPGRSAHQAVARAQEDVKAGYGTVVDLDLEKFFDRVHHDRLLSRLAREIGDKRVLKLIRAYLSAGILRYGLVSAPTEGTPQGRPLSPFLSNVVLDGLDEELERRGHRFVRYADDCKISGAEWAGGRASDGERDPVGEPASETARQSGEECGGHPPEAEVLGLHVHGRPIAQPAQDCAGIDPEVSIPGASVNAAQAGD